MARVHRIFDFSKAPGANGYERLVPFTEQEEAAADEADHARQFLPLNRIQFEFMVEKLGVGAAIEAAIEAIPEGDEQILARVLYRSGQLFERGHSLFTTLAPAVGLTTEQIDAAWLQAMAV